jgi:hypothetical protein
MIGVIVCLDHTYLLDSSDQSIRSKVYSLIATLSAFYGNLMSTFVAVFRSHNDDHHPYAHHWPISSNDETLANEAKTIGKRDIQYSDAGSLDCFRRAYWCELRRLFQKWCEYILSKVEEVIVVGLSFATVSKNGRNEYAEKWIILLTNSDIMTGLDPTVMSDQLNKQNLAMVIVPSRTRPFENDDRHRTLADMTGTAINYVWFTSGSIIHLISGGAYMRLHEFSAMLPTIIQTTVYGAFTLRQAFLQMNSSQVQPQTAPSDSEPTVISGDTVNEQRVEVNYPGDIFLNDGFSSTSDFN